VPIPISALSAQPPPSFWQRRVIDPILRQLTQGISVQEIALTLAVGSACALFPILGTTTLLCLAVGIVLRLNQPLIQLVNGLCTLPHLLVIYGLIRLSDFIFGIPSAQLSVSEFLMRAHTHPAVWILFRTFWDQHGIYLHRMAAAAIRAVLVWLVLAPFWIAAVYWISRRALHRLNVLRGGALLPERNERPAREFPKVFESHLKLFGQRCRNRNGGAGCRVKEGERAGMERQPGDKGRSSSRPL